MGEFNSTAANAVYGCVHDWLIRRSSLTIGPISDGDFEEKRKSELKTLITEELPYFINNVPEWFEEFAKDPDDDYSAALISFGGLTIISRAYRLQSHLQSRSKDEYLHRQKKSAGIDISLLTRTYFKKIHASKMDLGESQVSLELLKRQVDAAVSAGGTALTSVVNRLSEDMDIGEENSPSVKGLKTTQRASLTFVNTDILLLAKLRGANLPAVPLLQPKPISAISPPQVRYPFAGQSYT